MLEYPYTDAGSVFNPHDGATVPRLLPWAMSIHMLDTYPEFSSPFNLAADDVNVELDTHRVTPRNVTKHKLTRGLGGKIEVHHLTYWDELERRTLEHGEELKQHGNHVVTCWAGEPVQVRGGNSKYRQNRVQK